VIETWRAAGSSAILRAALLWPVVRPFFWRIYAATADLEPSGSSVIDDPKEAAMSVEKLSVEKLDVETLDVEKLARELANLRYETEYRFENGMPFCERLSEAGVRAVLNALQGRGHAAVQDVPPQVESPSIYEAGRSPHAPAR
jgi:hypothetical protein